MKFTPRSIPSSAGSISDRASSSGAGATRCRHAEDPSFATLQSRKTPEQTSSTRTFFPARVRHGLRIAAAAASADPTSPSETGTGASGRQNRACVVPNVTKRSGSTRLGVKRIPRTAGGVVW